MTQQKTITAVVVALTLVLAPWTSAGQEAQEEKPHQHDMMTSAGEAGEMPTCQDMMEHRQAMQKRMKEMDAKLDRLVEQMRAAEGDAKVEATAAVVEALVEQRQKMHAMMMEHQPMMMRHMAGHMGEMGQDMAKCPMMKSMGGMDQEADGGEEDHSAHHR